MGTRMLKPGETLRKLRVARGLTLDEVSGKTGLAASTLSKIENNKMSLTFDKLQRISNGLNIDISELFKNGAASQEQLDQAELTLSQEEKQVAQSTQLAGIKLSNARLDLDRTKVRATRNGIILFCPAKEGMAVTPGTELCQIGELSKLVVELPVDEIDITQIKLGQPATITQEGLTELKLKGTVIAIAPQAVKNQNENVFPVKIRIDNSSGMLRSGMSVDTEIVTNDLKDVLTVPLLAVLEEEHNGKTEKYLFKVIDGKAVKTKITAGFSSDSELEVLGGIKEGDTYVPGDYETILHLKDKTAVWQRVLKPQAQPKANQ